MSEQQYPKEIYHERQHLQHCLLHCLNNCLQESRFTCSDLNRFADQLAPGRIPLPLLHPHRTVVVGNWGIHVLELALSSVGKELHWHDARQFVNIEDLEKSDFIVVNIESDGFLGRLMRSRHWFGLRSVNGMWLNLDSKLAQPIPVISPKDFFRSGTLEAVQEYLNVLQNRHSAMIFFVY